MKKKLLLAPIFLLVSYCSFSQSVGIGTNTPDVSALLDITSTSKGLLIPRMNTAAMNAIPVPATGLLIYDSLTNRIMVNIGIPAAPNWQPASGNGAANTWNLTGNAGINPANQFIGTTDNQPLRFRVNNINAGEIHPENANIFFGLQSGQNTTLGSANTATGFRALSTNTDGGFNAAFGSNALFSNTTGGFNTAIGAESLFSNTTGNDNTATGWHSLASNTTGVFNSAYGAFSLAHNTTADNNTAVGFASLNFNTTGHDNSAFGLRALFSNTEGGDNTAIGANALFFNTTGNSNVGVGNFALHFNTGGLGNTATGSGALFSNTIGSVNTANGDLALNANTSGSNNTALGVQALFLNTVGHFNTAVGGNALGGTIASSNNTVVGFNAAFNFSLGSGNTIIGSRADVTQNGIENSIAIGVGATIDASNIVRFGNIGTTSIGGQVGFSNLSDGRYKKNIHEDVKGIDFIMKLRPVTYQLDVSGLSKKFGSSKMQDDVAKKGMEENSKTIFTGFVAQEVEQAAKEVGYNFSGVDKPKNDNDLYGLRYSEFVVPLVKAVQEQQRMIEELKKQNIDLQKRVQALEKK